jgi:hypothetical protein
MKKQPKRPKTTEQLAEMAVKALQRMSEDERAKLRARLRREFDPKGKQLVN